MHPLLVYYAVQARTAELHQQAQRHAQAQAASPARHSKRSPRAPRGLPAAVARRLRTVLGDSP